MQGFAGANIEQRKLWLEDLALAKAQGFRERPCFKRVSSSAPMLLADLQRAEDCH